MGIVSIIEAERQKIYELAEKVGYQVALDSKGRYLLSRNGKNYRVVYRTHLKEYAFSLADTYFQSFVGARSLLGGIQAPKKVHVPSKRSVDKWLDYLDKLGEHVESEYFKRKAVRDEEIKNLKEMGLKEYSSGHWFLNLGCFTYIADTTSFMYTTVKVEFSSPVSSVAVMANFMEAVGGSVSLVNFKSER